MKSLSQALYESMQINEALNPREVNPALYNGNTPCLAFGPYADPQKALKVVPNIKKMFVDLYDEPQNVSIDAQSVSGECYFCYVFSEDSLELVEASAVSIRDKKIDKMCNNNMLDSNADTFCMMSLVDKDTIALINKNADEAEPEDNACWIDAGVKWAMKYFKCKAGDFALSFEEVADDEDEAASISEDLEQYLVMIDLKKKTVEVDKNIGVY